MSKNNIKQIFFNGIIKENPTFAMLLGMCPTLGVTTSSVNGMGMGIATMFVLILSNMAIASVKDFIPDKVRIPAFIVIIASFVTIIDMSMEAYLPGLYSQLGIFIPLIVVNCIILGRAEAFASKNNIFSSMIDGLAMGLGFTIALTLLGSVREILGNGSLFGYPFLPKNANTFIVFILPPGAFIALAYLTVLFNKFVKK